MPQDPSDTKISAIRNEQAPAACITTRRSLVGGQRLLLSYRDSPILNASTNSRCRASASWSRLNPFGCCLKFRFQRHPSGDQRSDQLLSESSGRLAHLPPALHALTTRIRERDMQPGRLSRVNRTGRICIVTDSNHHIKVPLVRQVEQRLRGVAAQVDSP